MRSYFGGVLCVCWSPDGRYVVAGGEDDLISVWSFEHKRVVARGEGHQSYVTSVAFDPYTTVLPDTGFSASTAANLHTGEESIPTTGLSQRSTKTNVEHSGAASSPFLGRHTSEAGDRDVFAYRLGSVGQDGQLCLWDLSEDALKIRRPFTRSRSRPSRMISRPQSMSEFPLGTPSLKHRREEGGGEEGKSRDDGVEQHKGQDTSGSNGIDSCAPECVGESSNPTLANHTGTAGVPSIEAQHTQENHQTRSSSKKGNHTHMDPIEEKEVSSTNFDNSTGKKEKKPKKDKEKSGGKLVHISFNNSGKLKFLRRQGAAQNCQREVRTFESCNNDDIAPKMHEVNLIAPLVAKKISRERLTALVFRDDCIVVANYEGFIQFWVRPGVEVCDWAAQSDAPAGVDPLGKHPGVSHVGISSQTPF